MLNSKKPGLITLVAGIIILSACTVQNHYPALSFFFDGVPDPQQTDGVVEGINAITNTDSVNLLENKSKPELYVHQPYLEKECGACHNKGQMGSLTGTEPGLCYQCHPDFAEKFRIEHGPAAAGHCTGCHNPHRSYEESLLIRAGDEQCLHCHESARLYTDSYHVESSENLCVSCHNPHGSDNHLLLRLGACYQCHGDLSRQYRVVHGPVAAGQCSQCHAPHYEKTGKLLIRKGRDMCFSCHDSKRINANETHADLADMNCTECHNPHGGDGRFMFNY